MKIRKYLKNCNEVYHITLDPKGPGVVRIHLVPPKRLKPGIPWVVIINGYSVLPLQTVWAVLLKEFITVFNQHCGPSYTSGDIKNLINKVYKNVKLVFPDANEKSVRKDLKDIIEVLEDVARGNEPSCEIGYLTLTQYAKDMCAPHRMDLMISSMETHGCWNCNQKCLLCYAGNEKMSVVNELTTEEWFSVLDKLKKVNVPAVTFTGGEPTLRDDLVELVAYASWFVTRLNTNGIRLTKDLCERLYKADLDSVQITLYSYDKDIHNKMVGGNHFDETVNGIKNAIEAGLDVSINTPLCSLNSDYVKTVEFGKKLGVTYFSTSGVIPTGKALEGNVEKLTSDEIYNSLKEAYLYAKDNNLEISFTSPGWINADLLKEMNMVVPSCGACLSNMAIAPNGDVIPCQSWLFENGLGNILKIDFKKIWNSKKCKSQRKFAVNNLESCALKEVNKQ
ncbi:MAG: radical SAM/SPASM domain-containing protein [Anaeroplasma sp.]